MAVVAVAVGLFQLSTIRPGHDWGGDFAQYILHARNIVEGRSYSDTGYLYNPNYPYLAPPTYPPLFPLLLAGVYAVCGLHLTAMKSLCILFFSLALIALFSALQRILPWRARLAVIVVVGFNPFFWQFKDQVLSDLPFLFLCTLSLCLMQRLDGGDPPSTASGRTTHGVLCGVVMFLSYATRSIGLVLPVCLIAHRLWRDRRLNRGVAVAVCTMAVGAVIENLTLHRDGRYLDQLAVYLGGSEVLFGLLLTRVTLWWGGLVTLWDNGLNAPVSFAVTLGAVVLSCVGFIGVIRCEGGSVLEFFALGYLGSVLLWPMGHDPRFLIPVLTLYVAYAAAGCQQLAARFTRPPARTAIAMVVLVIVAGGYACRFATFDYGPLTRGATGTSANQLFEFVRDRTESTDVLVFIKPRVMALMTGRRCSVYHVAEDDSFWEYLVQIRAAYLITARWSVLDRRWLDGFIGRHRDRLDLVHGDGDHRVYRVNRGASASTKKIGVPQPMGRAGESG